MNQTTFTVTFLFFMLTCVTIFGQTNIKKNPSTFTGQADSLITSRNTAELDPNDDFSTGLFSLAMIGFIFILVCVGAGIALTVLGLSIVFGLVSLGILSTSIIVGLNKKSLLKGFKTFIVLTSTIGGLLFCGMGFWLLNKILHWWTAQTAILTGAFCGLLAGVALGLLFNYILQRLTNYFKTKLKVA